MPRIPIIVAQSPAAVATFSRRQDGLFGRTVDLRGLQELSGALEKIATRLDENEANLHLVDIATTFDTRMADVIRGVLADPMVRDHEAEFVKRADKLYKELAAQVRRTDVAHAFQIHAIKQFGPSFQRVREESLKRQGERQIAMLDKHQADMSQQIAEQDILGLTRQDIDRIERTFFEEVDRTVGVGLITAIEGEKRKQSFRRDATDKFMVRLSFEDPERLRRLEREGAFDVVDPLRRAQIFEKANEQEEEWQNRQAKVLKEAQDIYVNSLWAQANDAKISQSEIEMGLRGEHPIVKDVKIWRTLAEANENPILGGGAQETAAIMEEYYSKEMSDESIRRARTRLNALRESLGRPSKVVSEALRRIQTDQERREAEQRAISTQERAILVQERSIRREDRRRAVEAYDAAVGPLTGISPRLDRMEEVQRDHERALLRDMIDRGVAWDEALRQILEMHKKRVQPRSAPREAPKLPSKPSAGEGKRQPPSDKTKDELIEEALRDLR